MTNDQDRIQPTGRSTKILMLGSTYGMLWTVVWLTTMAAIDGGIVKSTEFSFLALYCLGVLLACLPTAMLLTWLYSWCLPRSWTWTVVPYGLVGLGLALTASSFIFLSLTLLLAPDDGGTDPQFRLSYWEAFGRHYGYLLRMALGLSIVTIAPPILAVLNCWDLRRRMMPVTAQS